MLLKEFLFTNHLQEIIEDGDTDEFNEAIKGFDIKNYEDLQVNMYYIEIQNIEK